MGREEKKIQRRTLTLISTCPSLGAASQLVSNPGLTWCQESGARAHGFPFSPAPLGGLRSSLPALGLAHCIPSQRLLPSQGLPVREVWFRVVARLGATGLLLCRREAASSGGMRASPESSS